MARTDRTERARPLPSVGVARNPDRAPRRTTLAFLVGLAMLAGSARAGRDDAGVGLDQAVSVDPLGFLSVFGGLLDVQYERRAGPEHSWAFRLGFGGQGYSGFATYSNLGVGGMYRFWIERRSIQGWYWGPSAALDFLSIRVNSPALGSGSDTGVGVAVGAEGGYQYIFPGGFTLDGALGLHYLIESVSVRTGGTTFDLPFGGFFFGVRIGLGYAWK